MAYLKVYRNACRAGMKGNPIMSDMGRILYATITFRELERWAQNNTAMTVIDLRDTAAYAASHFKGAVNLPYENMDEWLTDLPWGELLVFYCSRGSCSMIVCNRLSAAGYIVVNVAGGYIYYNGKYKTGKKDQTRSSGEAGECERSD